MSISFSKKVATGGPQPPRVLSERKALGTGQELLKLLGAATVGEKESKNIKGNPPPPSSAVPLDGPAFLGAQRCPGAPPAEGRPQSDRRLRGPRAGEEAARTGSRGDPTSLPAARPEGPSAPRLRPRAGASAQGLGGGWGSPGILGPAARMTCRCGDPADGPGCGGAGRAAGPLTARGGRAWLASWAPQAPRCRAWQLRPAAR